MSRSSSRTDFYSGRHADESPPRRHIGTSASTRRVETPTLSRRLYFRAEPLGTITMDSALPPSAVIENLEARGREWRESAIPDDVREFASSLAVQVEGSEFKMKWSG